MKKIIVIGLIVSGVAVSIPHARAQSSARPTIANEADFRRAMKELSNWGRWGERRRTRRRQPDHAGEAERSALALAKEGLPISLAHDIVQEHAADAPNILERVLGPVSPAGTADQYRYTGTYHGIVHSHLDSVNCHMMVDGKGYNGRAMEDITAAGGCPKGNINALKDGVVTRAILFDATLLPGKATDQGWVEARNADPSGGPRCPGKARARDGLAGRRDPSVYRALETARRARRLAEGNRVRRLSRRCCVLSERAWSFLHWRRRAERCCAYGAAGIRAQSLASVGAGRDGRGYFR